MVLTKRPWGSEGDSNIRDRVSLETSNAWNPGDCCSTNLYVCDKRSELHY